MPLVFCDGPGTVYTSHLLLITVYKADIMIPSQTKMPARGAQSGKASTQHPSLASTQSHDLLA